MWRDVAIMLAFSSSVSPSFSETDRGRIVVLSFYILLISGNNLFQSDFLSFLSSVPNEDKKSGVYEAKKCTSNTT